MSFEADLKERTFALNQLLHCHLKGRKSLQDQFSLLTVDKQLSAAAAAVAGERNMAVESIRRQAIFVLRLCQACIAIEEILEGVLDYPTTKRKEEATICKKLIMAYEQSE